MPDLSLDLPGDLRAAFRAHGELHSFLGDVHPQRRVVASLLVDTQIDGATPETGEQHDLKLRLWRLPGRLQIELRTRVQPCVPDRSRLVLHLLAECWEVDGAARAVRIEILTTPPDHPEDI